MNNKTQTTPSSEIMASTPPASAYATPASTRTHLTTRGASHMLIRHALTQKNSAAGPTLDGSTADDSDVDDDADEIGGSEPGLLGVMVRQRKRRALQLYLLLLAAWPFLENRTPLPAAVWARALTTKSGRKWSTTTVSEAWGDLEDLGLVDRQRLSRSVRVTPRREDGSEPYTRPTGENGDTYFSLPSTFWTNDWFETLSAPAIAMLLIIAARTNQNPEAWMAKERIAKWYGLSPRTVGEGLTELKANGLATERIEWKPAPLSTIGTSARHYYSLTGEFATAARAEARQRAGAERDERIGRSAVPPALGSVTAGAEPTAGSPVGGPGGEEAM